MKAGRTTRTAHKYFTLVYNESVAVVAIVLFSSGPQAQYKYIWTNNHGITRSTLACVDGGFLRCVFSFVGSYSRVRAEPRSKQ